MNSIEFSHVCKKFKRGEKLNSLRDMIPYLFKKALPKNEDLQKEEFWALEDVSFSVKKGEVFGIIGNNGAGKSTCLKLLSGIMKPNKGMTQVTGRLSALIEVTAGFHPELTGRENVYLNGAILGMSKKEIDSKFNEILEFSGIGEFIDTPVKRYSSGMYSRLGFSVAAHMDADVLLVDEVLSVGDMAFQSRCAQKMRELLESKTTSIILVSHNLPLIQTLCKRVLLLNKGKVLKEGTPGEIIPHYQNLTFAAQEEGFKKVLLAAEYKVALQKQSLFKIESVFLYDKGGVQKNKFKFAEAIKVSINFDAKEEVQNPVFCLDIVRFDGVLCCSFISKDGNKDIGKIYGRGSVEINLKELNLAPAIYTAQISVWDKDLLHQYENIKQNMFAIESHGVSYPYAVFLPKAEWKWA